MVAFFSVIMTSCSKDDDNQSDGFEWEDGRSSSTDDESDKKEASNDYGKISLVSKNGMTLKVKFEVSSDVDFFYCGKGTNISEKTKNTGAKTYTYDELDIGKEYTFTLIPYTKDGKRRDPIRATFSTSSSPYANFLCIDGDFYKLTSMASDVQYAYGTNGTGSNWKYLRFYVSNSEYVVFRYAVHEWEAVSSDWGIGSYTIENGGYYTYGGTYFKSSKSYGFDEGKMTIQYKNRAIVYDFDCMGNFWSKRYVGHAVE